MKGKIVFSGIVVLLWIVASVVFGHMQGSIESSIAVGQLQDSAVAYSAAKAGATGSVKNLINLTAILALVLTWLMTIVRYFKSKPKDAAKCCGVLFIAIVLSACGPYQKEVFEEIGTNETAFVVPLEGASKDGQGKFMSVDYLNQNKVASKRIVIPTRKRELGRTMGDFEWVPTVKVIKVNRTPISREWTKKPETGTAATVQAIGVESRDSIGFWVGVTTTGMITEEDAAKFLYFFAGKPLSDVMDQNVRPFIGQILATEFGSYELNECRTKKTDIFKIAYTKTVEHFKDKGITILNLGSSEGLIYENVRVQEAIDQNFVAEMDKTKAQHEKLAQDERNKRDLELATTKRKAAEEFAKAAEAQTKMINLEIARMQAEAQLEVARKIDQIKFPNILPQGTNFFMGLDTAKK
jgi:hypothetical protein